MHFDPLVKKMSDVNHLSGPLRKRKFSSTGSKGHCLWFVIGGFRSVLWVSVFQGSLLVIVMTINGNEKRNCEGGFWASEFACFEKPSDLHQKSTYCNGLPSKTINVTTYIVGIISLISTLPTTWLLHSQANTHVSLFKSFSSTGQA